MPISRVAERYAKSIFDLALERGQLEEVYHDMLYFKELAGPIREFRVVLRSPVVKADKKEKILDVLTKGKIGPLATAFYKLLIHKGREFYFLEIIQAFIDRYKEYKHIYQAKLTTAVPLSETLRKELIEKIKKDNNLQEIELSSEVDKNIIGGFILEIEDKKIDASVAYELAKVRKKFESSDYVFRLR